MMGAGCGGGSGAGVVPTSSASEDSASPAHSISGSVKSGSVAIGGAKVEFYAAGSSDGSSPTPLAATTTDAAGTFSASISCPTVSSSPSEVYAIASGGNPGLASGTNNAALRWATALGDCTLLPASITLNELTSVAAAFALNSFSGAVGIEGDPAAVSDAMGLAQELVDPVSGSLAAGLPGVKDCSSTVPAGNCITVQKINALADAVASCSRTAGRTTAACLQLMACATAGAAAAPTGVCIAPLDEIQPSDTLAALRAIAQRPGTVAVGAIYALASAVYTPLPAAAPSDWTLALNFQGGGLSQPTGIAIDAGGAIWVANYEGSVSKLAATGQPISPANGYQGGGLEESFGIAVDSAGHVWVTNEQSSLVNSSLGSLTELGGDGSILSSAGGLGDGGLDFPQSVAIDTAGHVWIANYGNSTLSEYSAEGAALSSAGGYGGGGLSFPVAIAVDSAGNVWVADQGANQISKFATNGEAESPGSGFVGGGLAVPQGVAVDPSGHIWVTNAYGDSVSLFDASGVPLSPTEGYRGGGLSGPGGIAIDGAGTAWVANYLSDTISALQGMSSQAPGGPLSPPSGFTGPGLSVPFALAVDRGGNLWVTNFGGDSVTEFIGIAAPVATPLVGAVRGVAAGATSESQQSSSRTSASR